MVKRAATTSPKAPPKKSIKRQNASPNLMNPPKKKSSVERKDITLVAGTGTAVGNIFSNATLLNGCALGATSSDRIGRKIRMLSLWIKGYTQQTVNGGNPVPLTDYPVRVLCVYDKQANGNGPTVGSILATNTFYAHKNLNNTERYIVLIDEIVHQKSDGGTYAFEMYRKLNLDVMFQGVGSAIADIATGSVYIAFCAPYPTGTPTFTLNANFSSRIRYTDD